MRCSKCQALILAGGWCLCPNADPYRRDGGTAPEPTFHTPGVGVKPKDRKVFSRCIDAIIKKLKRAA